MFIIVALFLLLQFTGNWYLSDRLGSVTGITDNNGNLVNTTQYDPYGHILSQSNPAVADSLGFTGREFDGETGLYYFRARYYNPDLGRFQSEDPVQFIAGDFSLNRYVGNSPTNFIDPYGLTKEEYAIFRATVARATTGALQVALQAGNRLVAIEVTNVAGQAVTLEAEVISQTAGEVSTLALDNIYVEGAVSEGEYVAGLRGIADAARLLGYRQLVLHGFRITGMRAAAALAQNAPKLTEFFRVIKL